MAGKLDQVKTFFDPHPGFAGAIIPIPEEVRRVANELDGKSMTLGEAIALIQAVTKGTVSVVKKYNFISLEIIEKSGVRHMFRVIRFK
jgi:hypothetical protein